MAMEVSDSPFTEAAPRRQQGSSVRSLNKKAKVQKLACKFCLEVVIGAGYRISWNRIFLCLCLVSQTAQTLIQTNIQQSLTQIQLRQN